MEDRMPETRARGRSGGERWPVAVVGAGAAGLVAAIFAARSGARTVILETRPKPGAKILVSGGGRCNVLPAAASPDDFFTTGSRATMRNILGSWPLAEVRAFFETELGVPLTDEAEGKVFPSSGLARDVLQSLLRAARQAGVTVIGDARVQSVEARDDAGGFRIEAGAAGPFEAARLVLATGGRSLPKTGSDGGGWRIAETLGHTIAPTSPALVPLVDRAKTWSELAGLALPAELEVRRGDKVVTRRTGSFLFTHRGYSGPVVLDVSRHFTGGDVEAPTLVARWGGAEAPDWDSELREGGARSVLGPLRRHLPRRLADRVLADAVVDPARRVAELTRDERLRLVRGLVSEPLPVTGHEGWRKAEVTAGGVPLDEIRARDLSSRRIPGLHLAGEMLDVTGRIGGFNFLWAWVTGRKAGRGAAMAE